MTDKPNTWSIFFNEDECPSISGPYTPSLTPVTVVEKKWADAEIANLKHELDKARHLIRPGSIRLGPMPTNPPPMPHPNVTMPMETVKKFNEDLFLVGSFMAEICEVPFEKMCLLDMMAARNKWMAMKEENERLRKRVMAAHGGSGNNNA